MQDFLLFMQNHPLLLGALIAVLILLTLIEFLKTKHDTHQLSPAQVIQLINHENAAVVDIRSQDAYMNGHIVGAISMPAKDLTDSIKIKKIEKFKAQPIVLVCAGGNESSQHVTTLKQQGFQTVNSLAGGMRGWKIADMPVVKG